MSFNKTKTHEYGTGKIVIQTATTTQSSSGQPTKSWSTLATIWAKIRTLSGNEMINAQQVQSILSHEFTIRYSSDVSSVKPDDRIYFDSRYFDIKNVRNVDERNIEIRMLCNEAVS